MYFICWFYSNKLQATKQLRIKHAVVELLLVFLLILHRSIEPLSFVDDLGIVRLKFDGTIEMKTSFIELLNRPMGNARSIECLDIFRIELQSLGAVLDRSFEIS